MALPRGLRGGYRFVHAGFQRRPVTTTQEVDLWISRLVPHPFIDQGSAVVSAAPSSPRQRVEQILCYFELNRSGAEDGKTWLGRVIMAGSRTLTRYPTTARALMHPSELVQVGTYDSESSFLSLIESNVPLLRAYLGDVQIT